MMASEPVPPRIAPEHRALEAPSELRELQGWLCWKSEWHDGEAKPRKVPMYSSGGKRYGKQGSREDRAKLTTFAAARAAAARRGFDGVGLALMPEWGITALDFDNCVDADGNVDPEITEIVGATYSEFSPSGHGIRSLVKGDYGNRKSPTTDTFGFETFHSSGYCTFTGNVLEVVELLGYEDKVSGDPALAERVAALCQKRFGSRDARTDTYDFMAGYEPRKGLSIDEMQAYLDALDSGMGRGDWVTVGMALHHECDGDDTGFDLWHEWSVDAPNYTGEEGMRYQWERFRDDGSGRRRVTMASVIKMANDARGIASVEDATARAEALAADMLPAADTATPEGFTGKFPVVSAAAMTMQPPLNWLVKGVLPAADLIILYGASGSGKSFVALQLAAAIAQGAAWRGHRVAQGKVVIIAAEGGGGYGKRIQAYCQNASIDASALEIGIIVAAPNVLDADHVLELVAAVKAVGDVSLVIVETLAQVTPGANENAADDMGRALANIQVLRRATGATVMVVHHAGKDLARGSRGWSGIRAAADAELEVTRDEVTGYREMKVSKMKDGDDGQRWGFRLEVIGLGTDSDGDLVTSCAVAEAEVQDRAEPSARGGGVRRRGKIETHILEVLSTLPVEQMSIGVEALVTLCADALGPPEEGKRDTRRQVIRRALGNLARERGDDAPLALSDGVVVLCC